jgi:uncharacterized protein YuzE
MTERNEEPLGVFELKVSDDDADVAYLRLPTHAVGLSKVSRSVRLIDLMGKYDGPEVVLDFDAKGVLVGIEILA